MTKHLLLTALLLGLFRGAAAQVSFGQATLMNDRWHFLRIDSTRNIVETADMSQAAYDDSKWRQVNLPHDWGVEQPMSPDKGSCQGYLPGGIGWYRRELSNIAADGETYVYLEGAYNYAEVYLNGHLLGCRPSGFASVLYRLTPWLRRDDRNVLAVRVNHSQEYDSRWYTGSGINRNVWLVTAPSIHFAQWGTAYRLKSLTTQRALVEVDIETADERPDKTPLTLQAQITLSDAEGRVVAKTETAIQSAQRKTVTLAVSHPRRWTLQQPYLYTLNATLSNGDTSTVRVGLRTLHFDANWGFALNGQWMKVKGVCLHDDAGVLGTAVPAAVWRRRLLELKAIGVNAVRLSHNPHMPAFYDLCDELGLLVMDEASDEWEFPKRKWMKGWNQGRPEYQGTYTYFNEWIDRDVADMVRRDRCHPSIFLWSIGNEVDYPNDPYSHPVLNGDGDFTQPIYGGYRPGQPNAERIGTIAQRLAKIVKQNDPSRPTTGALAGVVMSNATAYPQAVDVVGYNYTESRYATDHKTYPRRIIYGSENRHDLAAWLAVKNNAHIFGQFLWTGIDYLGESGPWPARGSSAGLLDLAGQRKPNGWYRAALWSDTPTCYIGTYPNHPMRGRRTSGSQASPYATDTWNYRHGESVRVVCYTNAPTARLLLNGDPIGGTAKRDEQTGILYWDIFYAAGTLRCEAANGASYQIKTYGAPVALKLTSDKAGHIFVEAIDRDGNRVRESDAMVTLQVQGARLLGMENGNMADTQVAGNRQPHKLRLHQGRLVAYIQTVPGQLVRLQASSPFLESATLDY